MKKTITLLLLLTVIFQLQVLAQNVKQHPVLQKSTPDVIEDCKTIYFSEFDNGSVANKALEIFNPQNTILNLNGYTIQASIFGQTLPDTIFLSGTISPKGTYVIASYNANPNILALANKIVNDSTLLNTLQILLVNPQGKPIDKIGSTQLLQWVNLQYGNFNNKTFKRDFFVSKGDTNWVQGQTEWIISNYNTADLHHHRSVCTTTDDIYINIDNQTYDCNTDYVDIAVTAEVVGDDNTILNYSEMDINYNTSVFGSYVVQNNLGTSHPVQLVNAGSPLDATYYNDSIYDNQTGDGILVFFGDGSITTNPDSMYIGNPPYPFFDLLIPIKQIDCAGESTGISFNNISPSSTYLYTDSVPHLDSVQVPWICDTTYYGGDSICYYDSTFIYYTYNTAQSAYNSTNFSSNWFNNIQCNPRIDNVLYQHNNPWHINDTLCAGTNQLTDLVTIVGKYFSSSMGGGALVLPDANAPPTGQLALDPWDITSWTNNEIKFKMPSYIMGGSTSTPGSGSLELFDDCGHQYIYPNITISYNIKNWRNSGNEKLRMNLSMENNANSRIFRCDTSVSHNPQAYACVKKAVREWNCYTGVNWIVGNDTTLAISTKDNVSYIYFSATALQGTTKLMQTTNWLQDSLYSATDSIIFCKETDIVIRSILNGHQWSYDTLGAAMGANQYSFYDCILHELGHAHMLNHVNDINDLMYANTNSTNRTDINSTNSPLLGAFNVIQKGVSNPPSNYGFPLISLVPSTINCIFAGLGVNNLIQNQFQLNVYPNPSYDGEITIAYQLEKTTNVQFKIVDYIGREIITLKQETKEQGKYTQQVDLSQLASGIYLLMANINGQYQTVKIIKN